jgi:simple sugar transport system ATP-binding protein
MSLATLCAIRKTYQSTATLALDAADFDVCSGEVHALVGENGAGKSTLAKILCGFERPDSGTIMVHDKPAAFHSHREAERAGIGFVPQYSMLAPGLNAAENIALGHEPKRFGLFLDRRRAMHDFTMLIERFGFDVDPLSPVSALSASARREVEILRALARGGDILVLDEPTSILGGTETKALFSLLRRLKEAGTGIVYISHRAREIIDLADRISVMRTGKVERTIRAGDIDECGLAELIVKTGSCPSPGDGTRNSARSALSLSGVSVQKRGIGSLNSVDIDVRAGEIVAVVALGGNGLDTFEDVVTGIVKPDDGTVLVLDREPGAYATRELRSRVMAYLPTDREGRGLCEKASVASNVVAGRLLDYSFVDFFSGKKPVKDAAALLKSFDIRRWEKRRIDTMSGGNRQRVVAARELDGFSSVVVAANPAQGLDPSARSSLFSRLAQLRDEGSAVLLLTSDPDDAAELADRAFALYRGQLKELADRGAGAFSIASALTGAEQ